MLLFTKVKRHKQTEEKNVAHSNQVNETLDENSIYHHYFTLYHSVLHSYYVYVRTKHNNHFRHIKWRNIVENARKQRIVYLTLGVLYFILYVRVYFFSP